MCGGNESIVRFGIRMGWMSARDGIGGEAGNQGDVRRFGREMPAAAAQLRAIARNFRSL
jgi:hypothetical protein